MKRPAPPFLELSFYLGSAPDSDAYQRLIQACIDLGGVFGGALGLRRGPGQRARPFAGLYDSPHIPTHIAESELVPLLADPDVRILQTSLSGVVGLARHEIATYVSISAEAAATDNHPVAIWTSGSAFCGSFRKDRKSLRTAGRKAYRAFRALLLALAPDYATITVDSALAPPSDLGRGSGVYAFQDFYLAERLVGPTGLGRLRDLWDGAYQEDFPSGLYVSSSAELNPDGCCLERASAEPLSKLTAQLVALVARDARPQSPSPH
jgi:hypothetical protein